VIFSRRAGEAWEFVCRNAESINDVRRSVGLEDVAELVESRRSKFIDKLIVSGKHVDLCLAAVHILDDFIISAYRSQ